MIALNIYNMLAIIHWVTQAAQCETMEVYNEMICDPDGPEIVERVYREYLEDYFLEAIKHGVTAYTDDVSDFF